MGKVGIKKIGNWVYIIVFVFVVAVLAFSLPKLKDFVIDLSYSKCDSSIGYSNILDVARCNDYEKTKSQIVSE